MHSIGWAVFEGRSEIRNVDVVDQWKRHFIDLRPPEKNARCLLLVRSLAKERIDGVTPHSRRGRLTYVEGVKLLLRNYYSQLERPPISDPIFERTPRPGAWSSFKSGIDPRCTCTRSIEAVGPNSKPELLTSQTRRMASLSSKKRKVLSSKKRNVLRGHLHKLANSLSQVDQVSYVVS